MAAAIEIHFSELSTLLNELFPNIIFFPPLTNEKWKIETDICTLIIKKNITDYLNKEILVKEMLKCELFDVLFQNEYKEKIMDILKNNNENFNIIKAYIEIINEKYIQGFNTVVQDDIKINTSATDIIDSFINGTFEDETYYLEDLKYAKKLISAGHSPASIYGIFEYYAHKQYTLIRLGREYLIEKLYLNWKTELEEKIETSDKSSNYWAFQKNKFYINFMENYENTYAALAESTSINNNQTDIVLAWDIITKLFIENLKILQTKPDHFESQFKKKVKYMIEKTLESTPKNYNAYIPTDFLKLSGQIGGQLGNSNKINAINADIHEKPWNEISFTYLTKKKNDSEKEILFDPEDKNNKEIGSTLVIKHNWERFINDHLKKIFKEDSEKHFINFVSNENNWLALVDEFISYRTTGSHNTNSILFSEYKGNHKHIPHTIFASRLRKALDNFLETYKKENPKETFNE